jgi:DNA-binding NarL/FixJ family response regulator
VRRGLRQLLETHDGWSVCAETADGRQAVAQALELKPDVALLDLAMPELDGLEATRQIRAALPATEVLVFTMHDAEPLVREVLAAGARGYVLKSDAAEELIAAVEAAVERRSYLTPTVMEIVIDAFRQGNPRKGETPRTVATLTNRERDVALLLVEGKSNREAARSLGISVKTVETHRAAILRKLGVASVVELVRYAIRTGLLDGEESR